MVKLLEVYNENVCAGAQCRPFVVRIILHILIHLCTELIYIREYM